MSISPVYLLPSTGWFQEHVKFRQFFTLKLKAVLTMTGLD